MASKLILEPSYEPGDTVHIVALERPGRVSVIRYDGCHIEFFVNWWDEGKRQGEWLFGDELRPAK